MGSRVRGSGGASISALALALALAAPASARVVDVAAGQQDVTVLGAARGDALGERHALAAGDLTGDGAPDLAMGAPGQAGPTGNRPRTGAVYVVAGPLGAGTNRDLAAPAATVTVHGARPDERLGYAIAIGDISGDGQADLVIGAEQADGPGAGRSDCGEVRVLFGPLLPGTVIDLATAPADLTLIGGAAGDHLGHDLTLGEVTGDGRLDLLVGAPQSGAGAVHVLAGPLAAGTIDLAVAPADLSIHGVDAGDLLGFELATGDVSGDGLPDILMSAYPAWGPGNSRPLGGEVHVVFGQPLPVPAVRDLASSPAELVVYGAVAGDHLNEVDAADLSGDGQGDLVVSADLAFGPAGSRAFSGQSWVLFGPFAAGTVIDLATAVADVVVYGATGDHLGFGQKLADLSGDGQADLVLGLPFADGPGGRVDGGRAVVLKGPWPSGTAIDLTAETGWIDALGAEIEDHLDHVAAGDVDGDGVADLLMASMFDFSGADGPGNARPDCGEVYVVLGGGDCRAASLTRVADLRGVKLAGLGARFSWTPGGAPEHHLNAVADPTLLDPSSPPPRTPRLPPAGQGEGRCAAAAPAATCLDASAWTDPRPLLYYQLLAACDATGAGEGPL